MSKTRDNHYVPQWYQKGFAEYPAEMLWYLTRRDIPLEDGSIKVVYSKKQHTTAQKFYEIDLYSTFFGEVVNDDVEKKLFGPIDDAGSNAVRAFLTDDSSRWHESFRDFFTYMDAQKLRTPKGLDWIKSKYPELSQHQLMAEMQKIRSMHCTLWAESVRELISAEESEIKFLISDHPVTVYNRACPPDSNYCKYPNDPDISFKGSQTIFPLSKNRCLVLTNLEYARDPEAVNPLEQRTHATRLRQSMVSTIDFINFRKITATEVNLINYVIKSRAKVGVAAGRKEWLQPEEQLQIDWAEVGKILLPPSSELHRYGGELYVGFEDGSSHYQDAFGRTSREYGFLKKNTNEGRIGRNENCGCGSGRKYKSCCRDVPLELRTSWTDLSIRERNLAFCNCIRDVLGLDKNKTWLDVRGELSEKQISDIYEFYSVLWPRETDIYSLLPKSDGRFRALYTGHLDVRVIGRHALPLASLFDEFLIESPIVNPINVKPEFSQIHSPRKFKCQALKDFLFMLELEPFIADGLINLIPSPVEFDQELMRSMFDSAKARSKASGRGVVCEKDVLLHNRLANEDFLNSIALQSRDQKEQALIESFRLSEEKASEIVTAWEHDHTSPLVLLQSLDENGGQFLNTKIGPNYEMALFVAQVTGAVIVTDSGSRWRELLIGQQQSFVVNNYPWGEILESFKVVPLDYELLDSLKKSDGAFSNVRHLLKTINDLVVANERDKQKIARVAAETVKFMGEVEECSTLAKSKIEILSPEDGIRDASVQRMLVRSSCTRFDDSVKTIFGISV